MAKECFAPHPKTIQNNNEKEKGPAPSPDMRSPKSYKMKPLPTSVFAVKAFSDKIFTVLQDLTATNSFCMMYSN